MHLVLRHLVLVHPILNLGVRRNGISGEGGSEYRHLLSVLENNTFRYILLLIIKTG